MEPQYINHIILARIKELYDKATSRIIFIDYDGTLIPFSKYPELAVINEPAEKIISTLTSDNRNKVIIISGRNKEFLEHQFSKVNVTLVAEHGFFIRKPGENWETYVSTNLDWKQQALAILNKYVKQCPGSFIEEKYASLAWHYRNVETDFAKHTINALKSDLREVLKGYVNLQELDGNRVLEIKSIVYNKGTAATKLLQQSKFEFIMATGDDKTDEDLFEALPQDAFSIKIGSGSSFANYYLMEQKQLYDFFHEITSLSV